MKYVYICSPYRPVGEDPETELRKNIDQAKRACRLAVSRGLIPLAPHLYFTQFLDDNDPQERKFGGAEVWTTGRKRVDEVCIRSMGRWRQDLFRNGGRAKTCQVVEHPD